MVRNEEDSNVPARSRSGLWHNRDFLKLWAGETVSVFGSRMGGVAVAFAAVIALGATPIEMGFLRAAQVLPMLLTSLVAGVWVDRLRRRPVMIAADLGRAALLATIPAAAIWGTLGMRQLYGVMLGAAMLDLVFDVSYASYLPAIVSRDDLLDANSKLAASYAVAEVGGFGLCGWLVQWLTAPIAVLVDALSFLVSAASIALIGSSEPAHSEAASRAGFIAEVIDGARYLMSDRRLRLIAAIDAVAVFSDGAFGSLYMLFVLDHLRFTAGALGMIIATGGVSALLGALAARRIANVLGSGGAMALGLALEGAALAMVPMAPGATAVGAALLVGQQLLGDAAATICEINRTAIVQAITPKHVLGRVNSGLWFIHLAGLLASLMVAAVLGTVIGMRLTLAAGAAALWVAATILVFAGVRSLTPIAERTES